MFNFGSCGVLKNHKEDCKDHGMLLNLGFDAPFGKEFFPIPQGDCISTCQLFILITNTLFRLLLFFLYHV